LIVLGVKQNERGEERKEVMHSVLGLSRGEKEGIFFLMPTDIAPMGIHIHDIRQTTSGGDREP
jgi:hypothetical protein